VGSKNERLDITMRLLGARQMETEGKKGEKSVEGVGKAARRTSRETTKTARATSVLTKSYGALGKAARYGIGFLGVGGVFALESAVTNTQELSKVTTGLNRNLDLSIQEGSRWAAMAHARGIATTALNMSFTKMAKNFVEANRKGGTARTALNQLGITYNQTARGAHDFNYALKIVGQKFGEAKSGPQRQAAGMALLGKGYQTILPLFAQGNKALKEQLGWADKYGVTLDGKTNSALMDMVTAQRESKVAMLGLQVTMTKAMMPAIEAGEEQLHKFIETLNDPDMSGEEKITAIQRQFEGIEDTLVKVISAALPKVAEHAGQLGVKMAEALWTGFRHSNAVGKIVIAAWIFKSLGGEALVKKGALRVGGMIGTELGIGIGVGVTGGFIVGEIFNQMSLRTHAELVITAEKAGTDFANFFVRAWNAANPLPFGIGDKGEFHPAEHDLTPAEAFGPPVGKGTAPSIGKGGLGGGNRSEDAKRKAYERLWGQPPPPGPPPWPPPKHLGGRHRGQNQRLTTGGGDIPSWSGRPIVINHKTILDGKVVAESTTHHAEDAAALR
jgi:hypothetical protein